jgi:hypothetical protein
MHFDRELKQDQNGDDVRLLHTSLMLFDLEVPSRERNQAHFGVGMRPQPVSNSGAQPTQVQRGSAAGAGRSQDGGKQCLRFVSP